MAEGAWLLVILLALAGLSILAYAIGALDMLGAVASFFLGLLVALLGGLAWIFLLVAFTGMGVAASRAGHARKKALRMAEPEEAERGMRGVRNVMGNGAAAGLVVLCTRLEPLVPHAAVQLAYATAVAVVAADTLASELGCLGRRRPRMLLPPFRPAKAGQNGAVSLAGHLAALLGAGTIAAAAVPLVGIPWHLAWVPLAGGFAGCQLDSLLGATVEGADGHGPLTKQDVNFLASAIPALLVLAIASLALSLR